MPTSPPPTTSLGGCGQRRARRHQQARAGARAGTVPPAGFTAIQRFLTVASLYVLVPSLTVAGSTLLPRRVLRPLSGVLAVVVGWVAWRWQPVHDGAFVELVS